jgi:hypothetical protein
MLVLTLAGLALLALAAVDLLARRDLLSPPGPLMERLVERVRVETGMATPIQEQPLTLLHEGLFERLSEADQQWLPQVEPLPDGGQRYLYKRRLGDPELSLAQIRALLADPPTYTAEQQAIRQLLEVLQAAGVRISLEEPQKPGAAAEWDHSLRMLRIKPTVVEEGSLEFARVLNHEAIHVAQSCKGGELRAAPVALGLSRRLGPELADQLQELFDRPAAAAGGAAGAAAAGAGSGLYGEASPAERRLEQEAYANQHRLELGASLVAAHCSVSGPSNGPRNGPGSLQQP